jgi:hypothetical protein
LHVDLQRVKVRSIALTVAFSEQMCQVASTGSKHKDLMAISTLQKGLLHFSQWEDVQENCAA